MLINLLMKHPDYTQTKIAEELDWDVNTVKYYMNKPKKNFVIMRHGTSQSGYWEVLYKGNSMHSRNQTGLRRWALQFSNKCHFIRVSENGRYVPANERT